MKYLLAAILFCAAMTCYVTATRQMYDDDKFIMDREYARELANWIMQEVHREPSIYTHKRNSEIINSLLGLPKVMNDAGRK